MIDENRIRILESRMAQVEQALAELKRREDPYPTDLSKISLPKATNLDFPVSGT